MKLGIGKISCRTLCACALVWAGALACSEKPAPIVVDKVLFSAPAQFDSEHTQKERLKKRFYAWLDQESGISLATKGRAATHRAILRLEPLFHSKDSTELGFSIYFEPRQGASGFSGHSLAVLKGDLGTEGEMLLRQAWDNLLRHRRLALVDNKELLTMLDTEKDEALLGVIKTIASRRIPNASQTLCALMLSTDNMAIALSIVGALVQLGDQEAVEHIITLSDKMDTELTLPLIFAVGKLGGRNAEGFLVTLASGHPHPAVQRSAKDALDELHLQKKRQAPQAKAPQ